MRRQFARTISLISILLLILGCDAALTVGTKTIGIRSGRFLYSEGYLRATYAFPIDKVWTACAKTLTDMKATIVERDRKIAHGAYTAMILDEKVRINVNYVEKGTTAVSIMVGTSGDNIASYLIHERIEKNLNVP